MQDVANGEAAPRDGRRRGERPGASVALAAAVAAATKGQEFAGPGSRGRASAAAERDAAADVAERGKAVRSRDDTAEQEGHRESAKASAREPRVRADDAGPARPAAAGDEPSSRRGADTAERQPQRGGETAVRAARSCAWVVCRVSSCSTTVAALLPTVLTPRGDSIVLMLPSSLRASHWPIPPHS